MGRKQHQSDKLYLTTQEWKYFFGGKKPGRATDPDEIDFKRLPFDHCSLSLQPFANPYCDDEVWSMTQCLTYPLMDFVFRVMFLIFCIFCRSLKSTR